MMLFVLALKPQLRLYIFLREIAGRPLLQIMEDVLFQQKHLGQVFFNHINRIIITKPDQAICLLKKRKSIDTRH